MLGLHSRDIQKLEEQLAAATKEHQNWLSRQEKETGDWHAERKELDAKIEDLNRQNADIKRNNQ